MKTSFVIGVVLLSLFTVIHANTCDTTGSLESVNVTCITQGICACKNETLEECNSIEHFNFDDDALIESLRNVSTHCQYSCGRQYNAEVYLASAILLTLRVSKK